MWPYDTPKWTRLSGRYLAVHPTCEFHGCDKPARICDHIETVKAAPLRAFDPTNLQALCKAHHNILTRAYDLGSIRGACDVDGAPVDPSHPWGQETNAAAIDAANSEQPPSGRLAARLKRAAVRGLPPRPDPHRSNRENGAPTDPTARADPPPVPSEREPPPVQPRESSPYRSNRAGGHPTDSSKRRAGGG